MPAPVLLATSYLAINFAFVVWIANEESHDRPIPVRLLVFARTLRYGPPLAGLLYLVTISGDWPFFLLVVAFFVAAFWMLDGLLNYPTRPPKR